MAPLWVVVMVSHLEHVLVAAMVNLKVPLLVVGMDYYLALSLVAVTVYLMEHDLALLMAQY